ncbi:TonB-dependent receptor [Prosthecochloris sp. N3]|uniref:TonB-dependent receptor n=1 Tax=Prosthecochloris ethylica TaxID=2743976 RepID=A0ABR9XNW1_9CHLB|nr:TonB-dependent receptor [Prosthecochloris ethylica]MBF0585787.1 TonB-dependent receptor [Prosthecochloris ethylica]MBF0635697.1 TonB-dependent receptor [Prosthecochloris ethylica]NUK46996.1 TonB-dependent receptor [Prosthecochloris ethylica]
MEPRRFSSSPLVRSLSIILLLTALLSPEALLAAAPGMLKGLVTDKADGEPVIGASVMLENTTLGAATGFDGNYTIQSIPEGSYSVKVTGVGYAPAVQNITISAGETATLDLQLGETTIMASEVVVGAALYEQDRLDVPVTTSVISEEEIKEEPSQSLDQVIDTVPGVNVTRSAGYSAATVQIRGSNTFQGGGIGTRINAFYDGFPINSPETGGIVWTNVNMNAADKVEVVKGAASTLYGSAAMGGVVNVFGSLPDTFEVKGGASLGFYDAPPDSDQSVYRDGYTPWLWNTYVGIGDKTEKFNYSLLYTHSEDDGYRDNSQTLLNDVKFKARYDIDANQYLQLTSYYNETEAGYVSTWPYDLVGMSFVPHPERAYDLVSDVYTDDTVSRKNILVGLNYVNLLSDDLSLDSRIYYTYNEYKLDYNPTDTTQYFPPAPSFFYIYNKAPGQINGNKSDRWGAGVKLDWRASEQHRLLFGIDGNIVDLASTQYRPDLPVFNEYGDVQEKNIALFIQDEFKMTDRFTALLSLRYDWSGIDADEVTYTDYTDPILGPPPGPGQPPEILGYSIKTASIEQKSVDAISPRLALNYKAADDLSFRASVGKSFRAPTLSERFVRDAGLFVGIPNPAIDKETMTAYEVGFFKNFGDKVSLDVAGYINDYDNLIESRNQNPAGFPIIFMYENVAKARIWGIETSLNVRPTTDLNFGLGYSYMNAKDKSSDGGALASSQNPDPEWLAYRPEHTASLSATWNPITRLTLNTTGRYVSQYKSVSTYSNLDRENYPGDFIVFNAGMKYKLTDNLTGSFLCRNITNEQYEEAEWFRAPGRSFILGFDFVY